MSGRPWYDYALNYGVVNPPAFAALPVCAMCRESYYAGHVCPRLKDLSPLGGGPKP